MRIGFVGLGKMGAQIVSKLISEGHEVVVTDVNAEAIKRAVSAGAIGAETREDLIQKLGDTPTVWLMIPDAFVEAEVAAFATLLPAQSVLIDGGNSFFKDSIRRAEMLAQKQINYIDVGTSGGVMGLDHGFSLMIGGQRDAFTQLEPIFQVLAQPYGGYAYMGPNGYGHYVKMVHNAVEYGMMQAYAEGYDLLKYGPLDGIELASVSDVWQKGSIVASTLNMLTNEILHENPELDGIEGYVADSGEGRWTKDIATSSNIAMPALESALQVRFDSQNGKIYFATKLLAAMRNKFGGHDINKSRGN